MTILRLVAEDDRVVVLWKAEGVNTGEGNGLPATGKPFDVTSRHGDDDVPLERRQDRRGMECLRQLRFPLAAWPDSEVRKRIAGASDDAVDPVQGDRPEPSSVVFAEEAKMSDASDT